MNDYDHDDWNGDVAQRIDDEQKKDRLRLEVRGVSFVFDSVEFRDGVYEFTLNNWVATKIKHTDLPNDAERWVQHHTDGFGNADAPKVEA